MQRLPAPDPLEVAQRERFTALIVCYAVRRVLEDSEAADAANPTAQTQAERRWARRFLITAEAALARYERSLLILAVARRKENPDA